jgi:hypothetical protein
MAHPIGDRAMTGAERQARYRAGQVLSLWRDQDTAETVAMRIWSQLSLGKARLVHAALGKLIRECEDVRQDSATRGLR